MLSVFLTQAFPTSNIIRCVESAKDIGSVFETKFTHKYIDNVEGIILLRQTIGIYERTDSLVSFSFILEI